MPCMKMLMGAVSPTISSEMAAKARAWPRGNVGASAIHLGKISALLSALLSARSRRDLARHLRALLGEEPCGARLHKAGQPRQHLQRAACGVWRVACGVWLCDV